MEEPKSSLKRRTFIFAFPKFGASLLLGIVGFALLKLYADGYGIDETRVTYATTLGYIAIAISQAFFGWLSDAKYFPKLGRRKPYILILTPIMFISFICLFSDFFNYRYSSSPRLRKRSSSHSLKSRGGKINSASGLLCK